MTERRSIVITGASSGIGRATALSLARQGWRVFGTVRAESDGATLASEGAGQIEPIHLEMSDAKSIASAAQAVKDRLAGEGLDALVNNAGVGMTAPVEHTSQEEMKGIYEVNLFGQIAVIQAFLPLIRINRGRVVNIGSVGDHLTPPFAGILASSKAAFASMSSALRLELRSQGIHVVLIEPGSINTPAVDKTLGRVEESIGEMSDEAAQLYARPMRTVARTFAKHERSGSPPTVVAKVIDRALNDRNPRTRYPAGKDSRTLAWLAWALPEKLLDLAVLKAFGLPTRFGRRTK